MKPTRKSLESTKNHPDATVSNKLMYHPELRMKFNIVKRNYSEPCARCDNYRGKNNMFHYGEPCLVCDDCYDFIMENY